MSYIGSRCGPRRSEDGAASKMVQTNRIGAWMAMKELLPGPNLVYHWDAGQTVWNGVARPPLIKANKDKKREGSRR